MSQPLVFGITCLCAASVSGLTLVPSGILHAEALPAPPVEAASSAVASPFGSKAPADTQPARAAEPALHPSVARVLEHLESRHTRLSRADVLDLARTIVGEARRHDLDPALVLAVIQVESGCYSLAVSHVGALGLMQIMPPTGEELARKHGHPWAGPESLFDPILNVKLGVAYLRQLADRYDGNVKVALAAYNWGPGRIDRFMRRGSPVPRQYAERVMENYAPTDGSS